jgi:ubiquitin-conjugating enzyme E2 variant
VQGNVLPARFEMLRNWKREYTIEHVLLELRREMASSANRKLQQPQEGAMYQQM